MGNYLGTDSHVTAAYLWTQFDTPPAALTPPHADRGVDTDGDGSFNEIAIDVRLQVDVAGDYEVQVSLWDSFGFINLGWNSTLASLGVGPQVVTIDFSTLPMVSQGLAGPYLARIELYTDAFDFLGSDTHMTQAYLLSEFDGLPAYFTPPHSDTGIDRDLPPDGQFNVLQVAVRLQVNDTGLYALVGQLWDLFMTTSLGYDVAIVPLAAGPQTVFLNFSGVPIRASGIVVQLVLFASTGGMPVPIGFDMHTTNPYLSTDFQGVVPETLSGVVRGLPAGTPIPFASVMAFDYLNEQLVFGSTDGTGSYALPLYQGDWVLLFDDFAFGSELRRITLTGPAGLDVDLFPTPPNPTTVDIVMPTWTDSDWTFTSTGESDNRTFRLQFDWELGDRDQVLSQAEFDNYLQLLGFPLPTPPADTVDAFEVDGATYDLVPGSEGFLFQNIPGPIDSTTPPRWVMTGSYANGSIAPSPTHTIDANVDYDTPFSSSAYSVTLPPGFVLQSYTAPPEVTVTGVGTNVAVVDPGLDPDPFDPITSVWIRLVAFTPDTTNPVVSSANASPDPSIVGQTVTVLAVATDNIGLGSVRLDVRDSGGFLVLSVTMTSTGPTTYEHAFVPPGVDAYTFTVTATDLAGNTGSRSGTFDVIERNPPVVTGVGATPSPQGSGLPVLLNATVTDDTGVASVSVEVRDAGGAVIGNYTMTYNATSGDWEVTRSFLDVGTLSFTVWATDTFGNVGSASGTFVIQDRTPPTADAGADRTVTAGASMTFDGTGSVDNDRIQNSWWTFADGGAQNLTGATPAYTFDTPGTYIVTLKVTDPAGLEDTDTVTITVTPAVGAVAGTVTGPSGDPVAGASVRLLDGTTEVDSTTTDANGQYDFADVPPGTYTVRVTATGYDAESQDVTVVAGQT
ncbi:MAG: carboxypeptidase regulatory-like domain-containing protein, partial [Candidatus Thermoplasmatota archaeon]